MALPEYLQDFATDFARQAKASYSAELDPAKFMGPQFIAGLDPLQTQAIGIAQAGVGSYAPFLSSAQHHKLAKMFLDSLSSRAREQGPGLDQYKIFNHHINKQSLMNH